MPMDFQQQQVVVPNSGGNAQREFVVPEGATIKDILGTIVMNSNMSAGFSAGAVLMAVQFKDGLNVLRHDDNQFLSRNRVNNDRVISRDYHLGSPFFFVRGMGSPTIIIFLQNNDSSALVVRMTIIYEYLEGIN